MIYPVCSKIVLVVKTSERGHEEQRFYLFVLSEIALWNMA